MVRIKEGTSGREEEMKLTLNEYDAHLREDKECLVTSHKKVPKIVLHRTHPPHLSMHRGSRSYHHRFKYNNGDPFKQTQHGSLSSNQTANYQCGCTHCECCTKKVTKIT